MKVIAIQGSPRKGGNTAMALDIVGKELQKDGIEFEVLDIGAKNIRGCLACRGCVQRKDEQCVIDDNVVNEAIQKLKEADGIVLGSPVYFSGIAGTLKSFLDRVFYVSGANGGLFRGKVAAAVTAVRRSGGSHTLDGLNHYITYGEMVVVSSTYWNIVHGREVGEMSQDHEAVQTMEVLGRNLSWMLRVKEKAGIEQPAKVEKIHTHFIR